MLTKCPGCDSDVSTEAASCPKCGHQFKTPGGFNPLHDPVHGCGCATILGLLAFCFLLLVMSFKG